MLQHEAWRKLEGLMFTARRHVEGLWAGRHASARQGRGMEFHDYRMYVPGDDLAAVDWKLFGRTDRWYVKRQRQLTDQHIYILLDASASMHFSGLDRSGRPVRNTMTKFRYAVEFAAAIAFLAIRQNDRIGVGIYHDGLVDHVPPGGTWAHLQRVCRLLEGATPSAGQADLARSMKQAQNLLRRRGVMVLLSDLLDEPEPLMDGLARLRHHHMDAIVFQILTSQEIDIERLGPVAMQMLDAETRQSVRTDLRQTSQRYNDLMHRHIAAIRRGCHARQADHNLVETSTPVVDALRRYLVNRAGGN